MLDKKHKDAVITFALVFVTTLTVSITSVVVNPTVDAGEAARGFLAGLLVGFPVVMALRPHLQKLAEMLIK